MRKLIRKWLGVDKEIAHLQERDRILSGIIQEHEHKINHLKSVKVGYGPLA